MVHVRGDRKQASQENIQNGGKTKVKRNGGKH